MFKVFRYFVDSVTVSYNTYRGFVPRDGHSNTFMSEKSKYGFRIFTEEIRLKTKDTE